MTRYERLIKHIEQHPADWVNSGIGREALRAATRRAPPEVLEIAKQIVRHDELMHEIFNKQDLNTEEGFLKLNQSLKTAPPMIQLLMGAKLKELGFPHAADTFSLEELAAAAGQPLAEVKRLVEQLAIWSPWGALAAEAKEPERAVDLEEGRAYLDKDSCRDWILESLCALRAGDAKKAEECLLAALEDVETVLAGGEL